MVSPTNNLDCSCGFSTIRYEDCYGVPDDRPPLLRTKRMTEEDFDAYFKRQRILKAMQNSLNLEFAQTPQFYTKSPEIEDFTDESELEQIKLDPPPLPNTQTVEDTKKT